MNGSQIPIFHESSRASKSRLATTTVTILMVALTSCFVGCDRTPGNTVTLQQLAAETESSELRAKNESLRQQVERQDQQIETLTQKVSKHEESASTWFSLTVVAVGGVIVGAVIALVIGTGLGQRARNDHATQTSDSENTETR